jgi:hypothetical protein
MEFLLGVDSPLPHLSNPKKCTVASSRAMALKIFLIAKIFEIKVLVITTSSDHVFSSCFSLEILFVLLVKEDISQLCTVLIHHAWN